MGGFAVRAFKFGLFFGVFFFLFQILFNGTRQMELTIVITVLSTLLFGLLMAWFSRTASRDVPGKSVAAVRAAMAKDWQLKKWVVSDIEDGGAAFKPPGSNFLADPIEARPAPSGVTITGAWMLIRRVAKLTEKV